MRLAHSDKQKGALDKHTNRADLVYLALKRFSGGNADFSDALIAVISENRGCSSTLTFDKKARSVGMVCINETGK